MRSIRRKRPNFKLPEQGVSKKQFNQLSDKLMALTLKVRELSADFEKFVKLENKREAQDMAREQELLDKLEAETNAGNALVTLVELIKAELDEVKAKMDPDAQEKIDEAIEKIDANTQLWAAKALANTSASDDVDMHAAGM